jgi:hypothetical protein
MLEAPANYTRNIKLYKYAARHLVHLLKVIFISSSFSLSLTRPPELDPKPTQGRAHADQATDCQEDPETLATEEI